MSSPYVVAAIGIASIVALAAIIGTSNGAMNNSLLAQQAIQIQTQKNQENLELIITGDVLSIKNKGLEPSTLKEMRIYSDVNATDLISKTKFPSPGLELDPLESSEYLPVDLAVDTFSTKTVLGITELGNVFAAINLSDLIANEISDIGNGTGDGEAMINGMGLNARILNYDFSGKLTHGYGDSGIENSLKPYNVFSTAHDFAGQILSTDARITIAIPNFYREYQYMSQSQSIQESAQTIQNLLGYSESKTVGTGTSSQGTIQITFSGTGTVFAKLNDYSSQTMTLEGNVPSGSELKIVEFSTPNLFSLSFDSTNGFDMFSNPYTSLNNNGYTLASSCSPRQFADFIGRPPGPAYGTAYVYPGITVSSQHLVDRGTVSKTASGSNYVINTVQENFVIGTKMSCFDGYQCGGTWCYYNYLTTAQNSAYGTYSAPTGNVNIWDANPIHTVNLQPTNAYQFTHTFPANSQNLYLLVKPNGNTITLKGISFNPETTPFLKITNLPPNIPYEILKEGKLAVSGMSDSNGVISLLANDVNIGGTAPTGTLNLYPNSIAYRGSFSTVVIDNVNGQTIHIPTVEDKVYVAHAYVNIPVTGNVQITNVYLDNTLHIPYLEGNYTTGNNIKVPVIPGYYDINMDINGVHTTTVISNVLGGTGLKVIPPSSNTLTATNDNNLIPSIESTTGSVAYVIPTTSGTLTASITATISGESQIYNYAYFGAPPPAPPAPAPRDPLRAWVDVYKNGVLAQTQQIYLNSLPSASNSGGVSGSSSYVEDEYNYPQIVINGVIQTNVVSGDFVEYYIYANIHADGSTPPIPSGHIFYHYSGNGYATATIHSGSILSS